MDGHRARLDWGVAISLGEVALVAVCAGWEGAARDGEGELRPVERPGIHLQVELARPGEADADDGGAGAGDDVVDAGEEDGGAEEGEADSVHRLEDEVVALEALLLGVGALVGQAEAEGDVGGEAELFAEGFLSFDLALLELVELEHVVAGVHVGGGEAGEAEDVEADEELGVGGLAGGDAVGGGGPDAGCDLNGGFEDVGGEAVVVQGRVVVVEGPAAVVEGDGGDRLVAGVGWGEAGVAVVGGAGA